MCVFGTRGLLMQKPEQGAAVLWPRFGCPSLHITDPLYHTHIVFSIILRLFEFLFLFRLGM